jgi:hypothetical protein
MDPWGWSALQPWLGERAKLPVGPLFCVIAGPTRGHAWSASAARLELHRTAIDAGVRRRLAPHQLRHAHAVELLHEGIPLPLIQRQLGHAYLSTTGTYLQGISSEEIISTVHARRAPMMHASAGLALEATCGSARMGSRSRSNILQPRTDAAAAREARSATAPRGRSGKPPWLLLVQSESLVGPERLVSDARFAGGASVSELFAQLRRRLLLRPDKPGDSWQRSGGLRGRGDPFGRGSTGQPCRWRRGLYALTVASTSDAASRRPASSLPSASRSCVSSPARRPDSRARSAREPIPAPQTRRRRARAARLRR